MSATCEGEVGWKEGGKEWTVPVVLRKLGKAGGESLSQNFQSEEFPVSQEPPCTSVSATSSRRKEQPAGSVFSHRAQQNLL